MIYELLNLKIENLLFIYAGLGTPNKTPFQFLFINLHLSQIINFKNVLLLDRCQNQWQTGSDSLPSFL